MKKDKPKNHYNNDKYIWLKVSKDKYEFPLIIADSAYELADKCGVTIGTIYNNAYLADKGKLKFSQYRKVSKSDDT